MKNTIFGVLIFVSLLLTCTLTHAQGATVFFTPSNFNFGPVDSGVSAMKPIVVNMKFDTVHTVHGKISLPADSVFTLIGSDTFTVGPRVSDTVAYIRFTPNAATSFTDTIYITHDGSTKFAKNPARITMTGQGLPSNDSSARILLSRTVLNWSNAVDTTVIKSLIIHDDTSTGTVRTLRGTIQGLHSPFALVGGDSNFTIVPGGYDTVLFSFMSTDTGRFADSVTIASNADSAHSVLAVLFSASATPKPKPPPKLSLSISAIDFGKDTLKSDTTIQVYLHETSGNPLRIQFVAHTPKSPFSVAGHLDSIPSNGTDTLAITFSPTDSGSFVDSLVFYTNELATPGLRRTIQLVGQGEAVIPPPPPPPQSVSRSEADAAGIAVYPNPAKDDVTISLTNYEAGLARIVILNSVGVTMLDQEQELIDGRISLPLSGVTSGAYHLTVTTRQGRFESPISIVK